MRKSLVLVFLRLCAAAIAEGQKRIVNHQFGFSMQEPRKWKVRTESELNNNLDKFEWTDEDRAKVVKGSDRSILIAGFSKYDPRTSTGLIPTIQVAVRPNGTRDFQAFKKGVIASTKGFKDAFENFTYLVEPTEIEISGVRSLFDIVSFTMRTADGKSLKVRSRTYAVPIGPYFFQINFTDSLGGEDCTAEFDDLVRSIKIGKQWFGHCERIDAH